MLPRWLFVLPTDFIFMPTRDIYMSFISCLFEASVNLERQNLWGLEKYSLVENTGKLPSHKIFMMRKIPEIFWCLKKNIFVP